MPAPNGWVVLESNGAMEKELFDAIEAALKPDEHN